MQDSWHRARVPYERRDESGQQAGQQMRGQMVAASQSEWPSGRQEKASWQLDMNHVAVEMRRQVLVGPTMQEQASLAGRGTIFD